MGKSIKTKNPESKRLQSALGEILPLVKKAGLNSWYGKLNKAHGQIKKGNNGAYIEILGLYGGMNSFSDVNTCALSQKASDRFWTLHSEIYQLCQSLSQK